jgi:hypothetical protein
MIFRGTFWIKSWFVLSKQVGRTILKDGCRALESGALEILRLWRYFVSLSGMLLSVSETSFAL